MYLDKNVRHDYVSAVAGLQSGLLKKEKRMSSITKVQQACTIFIHCHCIAHNCMPPPTWISVSESSLKNRGSMSGSGSRECGCCSSNQRWALLNQPIRAHLVQVHGLTPPHLAQPPPLLLGTRLEIRAVNEYSRWYFNIFCHNIQPWERDKTIILKEEVLIWFNLIDTTFCFNFHQWRSFPR